MVFLFGLESEWDREKEDECVKIKWSLLILITVEGGEDNARW